MDEDEIYEMWVVPPRSARYVWLARGFPSVGGPVMYEQEGIMRMMFSFKVSGQPLQMYPVGVWKVSNVTASEVSIPNFTHIGTPTIAVDDFTYENSANELGEAGVYYRNRLIVPRKWETWSKAKPIVDATDLVFTHPDEYSGAGDEATGFHGAANIAGGAGGAAGADTSYITMLYREGGKFADE